MLLLMRRKIVKGVSRPGPGESAGGKKQRTLAVRKNFPLARSVTGAPRCRTLEPGRLASAPTRRNVRARASGSF